MVDIGAKPLSARVARASGQVLMAAETLELIRDGGHAKGNVLEVARLAGIMGAKQTQHLIPLCHSLALDSITIDFEFPDEQTLSIAAIAKVEGKTGVEMEALTAVAIAALTVYDMCKAVDRAMKITSVQLDEKSGGRSGHYIRTEKQDAS